MPSSATLEVFSLARDGARRTKRTIQATDFDPRLSIFSPDDENTLPILASQADPSQSSGRQDTPTGASNGLSTSNPSRSVSVSLPHVRHVISPFTPLPGANPGMAPTPRGGPS